METLYFQNNVPVLIDLSNPWLIAPVRKNWKSLNVMVFFPGEFQWLNKPCESTASPDGLIWHQLQQVIRDHSGLLWHRPCQIMRDQLQRRGYLRYINFKVQQFILHMFHSFTIPMCCIWQLESYRKVHMTLENGITNRPEHLRAHEITG